MDDEDESILHGFKLAIKDPLVLMFTAESVLQILGISFVNFFPTYVVYVSVCLIDQSKHTYHRLTATLGYSTTVTLLLAAYASVFL